ncbi:uncharacterized protein LOC130900343 [Diorhabda carinulata]|uniref:uncharacterized protein LOC130900343 n=1 Tax=Diorhabda carinulata TaxID=1163345 RepID=UPI0025A27C75|nr:uncharacterized protein LOC130900343 [Diorhabda carinulata]
MNYLTVVLIVAIVCFANAELTAEQHERLKEYNRECSAKSGVGHDVIAQIKEGQFPDDEKFENHIICLAKKIGFINDSEELQTQVIREKMKSVFDDHEVTEIIKTCTEDMETDDGTTFEKIKCFLKKAPKDFLAP